MISQGVISRPQSIYGDISEAKTPPQTSTDFGMEEVHHAIKQLSCNDDGTVRYDADELSTIMKNNIGKLTEGGSFSSKG